MDWLLAIVPTCMLALATFASSPKAAQHWCVASVETVASNGVVIVPDICDEHSRSRLGVTFKGPLPAAVCRGSDVYIVGRDAGGYFEATSIQAFNYGKYDGGCWRFRCLSDALRPE